MNKYEAHAQNPPTTISAQNILQGMIAGNLKTNLNAYDS
jgi:hypothetical protein